MNWEIGIDIYTLICIKQITNKNIIEGKDICMNRVLMQMKVPYSGKKIATRTFVSKEEKCTPGFKAGRGRLTWLFCEHTVGFMIQTTLIYKANN